MIARMSFMGLVPVSPPRQQRVLVFPRLRVGLTNTFNLQDILFQKLLAFGTGKDARRGADRPDAARAESAGIAQTILDAQAVQQTVNVTRVKGVAAAGTIHELD